jgi:hypothetical protein
MYVRPAPQVPLHVSVFWVFDMRSRIKQLFQWGITIKRLVLSDVNDNTGMHFRPVRTTISREVVASKLLRQQTRQKRSPKNAEERWWCAELHRLHGVFLAALGADETQIEASFCEAIRIAKEQKSISLEKRAEATYAEYRRQKASAAAGRGFRLPLW